MNKMPKSPPPAPKWLTKVQSRGYGGLWKFHKSLGHAKNALSNGYSYRSEGMELYEWKLIATEDKYGRETLEFGWQLLYTWSYGEPRPW
jgi:hypothetical protein